MKILGISAFYHDSAAALIQDGEIIAAAQEERFSRIKHDAAFPVQAISYCLQEAGLILDELDAFVFYDKPLLKFERLLETYYRFAPKGLGSFIQSLPIWLREKIFLKRIIYQELKKVGAYQKKRLKLLFPEHHLSHAASAFYPSSFSESAILTLDGVGEWATASICMGQGKDITLLKELHFPHSIGLLYSAFTYFLGFHVNAGEYKLMGLAPYGDLHGPEVQQFIQTINSKLVRVYDDGSIWLNQKFFSYCTGLRMIRDKKWAELFGFPRRTSDGPIEQHHCNLALAIQQVTEEIIFRMAVEAKRCTGARHLCLAGGVALNCVANGMLIKKGLFEDVFIQPAAGDSGGALGAALAAHHIYFDLPHTESRTKDLMSGAYLGPAYSEREIEQMAKKYRAPYQVFSDTHELVSRTAALLEEGNVIGWFQGRMEYGPRALGARSILADPRRENMQKKLNARIKHREHFRPFAPAVLAEEATAFFDLKGKSPYMLQVHSVSPSIRKEVPENYAQLPLLERLYVTRSALPAITHVDFSARIQTVHQETNSKFHALLRQFKDLSGFGVLVNTSFNVRGEPIVCTPEDAYRCFMQTEIDHLVMGNFIFSKALQPLWESKQLVEEPVSLD